MTGSTQQGYLAMMLKGGRAVDGNRSKASGRTRAAARIVAGIAFLARAGDRRGARTLGKTEEPYWKRVFSGFDKSKEWLAKEKPDVCIGGARRNVAKSHYIRSQKGHWESRGRTYQARTLHRQGVFHPQTRGQYLGMHISSRIYGFRGSTQAMGPGAGPGVASSQLARASGRPTAVKQPVETLDESSSSCSSRPVAGDHSLVKQSRSWQSAGSRTVTQTLHCEDAMRITQLSVAS
jgi:hypothetical protein